MPPELAKGYGSTGQIFVKDRRISFNMMKVKPSRMMEQLNKVEQTGTVGSVNIRRLDGTATARFSVATTYQYGNLSGATVFEATWHVVRCWEGPGIADLERLAKGASVHVQGRLQNCKYISADGSERVATEIIARSVEILGDGSLPPQQP